MSDNFTWQMAADFLEEKGFEEQATALRVIAGLARVETWDDPENLRSVLAVSMDKRDELMGDFTDAIDFVLMILKSLESRHRSASQAHYDIIQRDEARFRNEPNGGV